MEVSAADLVERARQQDADAFAILVRRFERVVLSVAFDVTGDAHAANDIAQDAFIRAWERLGELREPARFGTWLCGIVRNLAIDRLRRKRRLEPLTCDTLGAHHDRWTHDPVHEACSRESTALIADAIHDLDEVGRKAVTLRYYEDLPSKEIGTELGISADAVDMRLIRARRRLRAALPALATA